MDFIKIVDVLSGFLWNYVLLFCLVGIGIYMSIRLKFPQFTRLFPALGKIFRDIKENKPVEEGRMTPFQSLSTAIAAQVGTGNIVGVATAVASGGPGAAFWMLLSAFFGMSTIFCEAVLAQVYREKRNGELVGGPAYYIKNGLKNKYLAGFFAVTCIVALGIVGILVQSNSVVESLKTSVKLPSTITIIGLIAFVGIVLTGGMDRIAKFTEKVVPVMAFSYVFGCLVIIVMFSNKLLPAIGLIFEGAFTPQAIGGGVLGITLRDTIRYGLARGLFSNEAGMGSTPHSHAVAHTDHPAEQGFTAMIGVFISTFLICLSTIIINLVSGSYNMNIPAAEMAKSATLMTQNAFIKGFYSFGGIFLSLSLTFFSLTTIVGWYFFAESNIKYIAGNKKPIIIVFRIIVLTMLAVAPIFQGDFVWKLSDLFMGLMALPNLIALILLSNKSVSILKDYDKCVKEGNVHFEYEFENK